VNTESTFFQTIGIHHLLICPHTHEQNGIVERRHGHIVETGLTLLWQCKAPFLFWNYAFETSVYLINRMPTPVISHRSPFDCLFQRSPDYHFCVLFGVFVFLFCVHIMIINWIFVPLHVCSLVIVPRILVIDALTLHLTVFIFLVMSTSMNMCFHLIILNRLQRSRTQPPPNSPLSPSQICSTTHHYPLPPASQTATSLSSAAPNNHPTTTSAHPLVIIPYLFI